MRSPERVSALVLFGAAMGFFEAACVVYLRRLWELGDHDLATLALSNRIVLTEVLREGASLVMIAAVATLAGRRGTERLACAAIMFGTWDILYYVFLSLLVGWPSTLFDWDLLFLIPAPWSGPVLAPVTVSVVLVAGGMFAILREDSASPLRPRPLSWVLALLGGMLVVTSFLTAKVPLNGVWPDVDHYAAASQAGSFPWPLFLAGLASAIAGYGHALLGPNTARGSS